MSGDAGVVSGMGRTMTLTDIRRELEPVGRAGQLFVDGDLCRKAWQPHAETFMCGDDMDYNPEAAVPLKIALLRLERFCRIPCATALWRRRPDLPDCGEVLLNGTTGAPDGGDKPANRGYAPPKMSPELRKVFLHGRSAWKTNATHPLLRILIRRRLNVPARGVRKPSTVQLFVPVKDSMGEIAAALEVFTVATVGRQPPRAKASGRTPRPGPEGRTSRGRP